MIAYNTPLQSTILRSFILSSVAVAALAATGVAQDSPPAATPPSVVITQRNPTTQDLAFIGAVVDRNGTFVAVNQRNFTGIDVTSFATTMIPFEGSVLGVPQPIGGPTVGVPFGTRASVLEDLFLNSNLQNPSVGTGIGFQFVTPGGIPAGLVNNPGVDLLIFELSPPPGSPSPSGGPTAQGGDPFVLINPETGASIQIFSNSFDQFGGNGFTGSTSFFASAGELFTSLDELENGELAFTITVPGLNLFATAVDLSALGFAEGETVTALQLSSIAATGFGPDLGFIAGIPGVSAPGITNGVLDLNAFGPFTEDFVLDILTPQSGTPAFGSIDAPLFTSIAVNSTDPLAQIVVGDFLLDGSTLLSPQATIVADHLTDIIGAGLSPVLFDALENISDLGPAALESSLVQLSPEPLRGAPTLLATEQADLHARRIGERLDHVRREGISQGTAQVWSDAFGALLNRDASTISGQDGFDPELYGVIIGADYGLTSQLVVGATAAYLGGEADFDTLSADTNIDTGAISLYGLYTYGDFYGQVSAGYGFGETDSDRIITGATSADTVEGSFDTDQFFTSSQVGWKTGYGAFDIEPSFELVYINVDIETFAETGTTPLALEITESPVTNVLFLEPELAVSSNYKLAGIDVTPDASIGYRFEALNDGTAATARFESGPAGFEFASGGVGVSRGAVAFGTGISASLSENLALSLDYDGLYDNDFRSHDLSLTARWAF